MDDKEQQPGTSDIGDSSANTPDEVVLVDESTEEGSSSSPEVPVDTVPNPRERLPLARPGEHLMPLLLSGFLATVMTVAFIAGVDSIFPGPVQAVQATSPSSDAATGSPGGSTAAPSTDQQVEPETGEQSETAPKTSKSPEADSAQRAIPGSSLLASILPISHSGRVSSASTPVEDDRPGPFGRGMILIKFVVVLLLGVGCGLVALGGLALSLDRPLGSIGTAVSRLLACAWLGSLALLVPSPEPWLLTPIHYVLAGLLLWASLMLFFRLSPRNAGILLGGTVSLLAVTVLGSSVVLWAAWG